MASKLAARIIAHGERRPIDHASADLRATFPQRDPDGTVTVLLSVCGTSGAVAEAPFTTTDLRSFFADVLTAIEREEATQPFHTEHNLSDHTGQVTPETECSGCGLEVKSWRASADCTFFDKQTDPETWPLFDPVAGTFKEA